MIQRQFHAFSLAFTAVFLHEKHVDRTQGSCDARLMQGRIILLTLLATAACMSAPAQTINSGSDPEQLRRYLAEFQTQAPLFNTPGTTRGFDLNGEWWGDETGSIFKRYVPKVRMAMRNTDLSVIEATENTPYFGQKFLSATYSGETSFLSVVVFPVSNSPRHVRITINDPDTLDLGGLKLRRHTPPSVNDIPCDPANPLHVQVSGAVARAGVAIDAHDIPLMVCWESVAAALGDAQAQYYTALALRNGIGTQKNTAMALEWLKKSVPQGNVDALKLVADMYQHGEIQLTPQEVKTLNESLDFYARAERNEQAAEQFSRGMDRLLDQNRAVSDALGGILGRSPEQRCGITGSELYQWYRTHLTGDPCAGRTTK